MTVLSSSMWYFTEFSVALSGLLFVTCRLVLRLPLASSFSLLGSFWLSLALTWSLCGSLRPSWLFWALSGSHLLTRHLLGSLTASCSYAFWRLVAEKRLVSNKQHDSSLFCCKTIKYNSVLSPNQKYGSFFCEMLKYTLYQPTNCLKYAAYVGVRW